MSEQYGPFEKYSEVMLDDGGVFGLRAGETLDVLENGDVEISPMPEPDEDIEEAPTEEVALTYEDEAPPETSAEPSEDESPPDAAAAFAEAQKNPTE